MPALDLLVKMQASHTHMALVIDEYGGTDGLVSIEDVVESIVGDIEDEHDEADRPQIAAAGDGAFIVEARASLEDVSKALGVDLSALADAEDVDTIGGLLTADGRPRADPRRNRRRPRRPRIRSARRRSAAGQAAEGPASAPRRAGATPPRARSPNASRPPESGAAPGDK